MDSIDPQNIETISSLFEDAPALIAVLKGPEHVYEYANKMYLALVGKTRQIIGLPIRKALPELEGQGVFELLDSVYQNDEQFKIDEIRADIDFNDNGHPEEMYFNLVYMPIRSNGSVTGIFVHAVDITFSVKTKKQLEHAQEKLRAAIEVANLGTWERNLVTGEMNMNQRLLDWRGMGNDGNSIEEAVKASPDGERVLEHMYAAMKPGSGGLVDIEYDMVNARTKELKRLHTQGRVFFNEEDEPVLMTGITHDVTRQRLNEAELEHKVASKTTELEDANKDLKKLNESLEQFVYIASHDLQEPLRKINVFSDMLLKSSADINDEGKTYIGKIEKAAKRMSLLISNLLEFSRINSKDSDFVPVDLNKILSDIQLDYELLIRQTNADLRIDTLPVIEAIPLQMYQLFYNLIGNALKFAKKEIPSEIRIGCGMLGKDEVHALKLNESFSYCNITIQDNGIGFDNEYALKIFELFQRLHGKQEYAGTGIGLSIVKKIAENHGGMISATSAENEGALFNLILPVIRS